jgi:hypothetical protein
MPSKHSQTTHARWLALCLPLAALLFTPSCLVDLDHRCGENQHYDADNAVCACDGDFALQGNACVRCGENETGSSDGCVCLDGFSRATPGAPCAELAALGQDCQSDADCGDAAYDYCAVASGEKTGYCTAPDCSTAADCPTDYGCNTRAARAYCERPPQGLGMACTSDADCAGNVASYCETVQEHACVVNDCKPDPNKCHGDWVCCDIGLLSQSLCVPPDALENGNCPVGGTLIPRTE